MVHTDFWLRTLYKPTIAAHRPNGGEEAGDHVTGSPSPGLNFHRGEDLKCSCGLTWMICMRDCAQTTVLYLPLCSLLRCFSSLPLPKAGECREVRPAHPWPGGLKTFAFRSPAATPGMRVDTACVSRVFNNRLRRAHMVAIDTDCKWEVLKFGKIFQVMYFIGYQCTLVTSLNNGSATHLRHAWLTCGATRWNSVRREREREVEGKGWEI